MTQKIWFHLLLFIITFFTCTLCGVFWTGRAMAYDFKYFYLGLEYASLLLFFLSVHEFGHYVAARIHKVKATLPYYIPFPPIPGVPSFGTMGAVIRIKEQIPSKKALFDIGVSGPLAGFIVCIIYLIIGFLNLPSIEYLHEIHPQAKFTGFQLNGLFFGDSIALYLTKLLAKSNDFIPPMNEIYHYPLLNVGFFGLFVTSLNLLPIGQLDGGHLTYALFGHKVHSKIAKVFWHLLLLMGTIGTFAVIDIYLRPISVVESQLDILYNNTYFYLVNLAKNTILFDVQIFKYFWSGWFFWALFTKFVIKLEHPKIDSDDDIGVIRKIIGIITLVVFVLSLSINGIYEI